MFVDYIDRKEVLDSIKDVLRIPSVVSEPLPGKPFGEECAKALEHTLRLAERMGFRAVNLDNKVGYAEYGTGEEMIAVLGHLDVVPAGDNWICEPFDGTVIDGKIYGRGIADDKGPIIGALYALQAVVRSGKPLGRRVRIIFGSDEEVDCTDMSRYLETEEIPAMAFTPDAEYPAIFSEKGILYYTLSKRVKGLVSAHGGEAVNQVPDSAEMTFLSAGKAVTVKSRQGRAAHGSVPQLGINAIDDMVKNLKSMPEYENMDESLKEFIRFYERYYLDDFYGEKVGMAMEAPEVGANSSNVGILFSEDDEIGIKVDFRFISQYQGETEGVERLKKLAEDHGLTLDIYKTRKVVYVPKDSGLIRVLQRVFKRNTGIDMEAVATGGGTYAKFLPNTVAFGPLFPGEEDPIHQPNEYMSEENLFKNIEIMADAIYELANYEKSDG